LVSTSKAIEQGIKKVEGAAQGAQGPISKVTSSVEGLATSKTKLSDAAHKSQSAFEAEVKALIAGDAAAINATKSTESLTVANTGLRGAVASATAATGLSTAALGALAAGIGTVVVGYGVLAAVIAKSTAHYFEHSKATKDSRDSLKELEKGWHSFQMMVGGTVLGENFSIVKPVHALNLALQATGVYLSYRIEETRQWIGLLSDLASYLPGGNNLDLLSRLFSNKTGPENVNLPAPYRNRDPRTGMSQEQFYAEARIDALHAALKRQSEAAKEASKALSRHNAEIAKFWASVSPGVTLGMGSAPGFQYPVGSVFGWNSLAPPGAYGPPSSLPGATGVGPGALTPAAAGFWAQNGGFQQGMANVAYGSGVGWLQQAAGAGQQIRAGINQGGIAGWTSAAGGLMSGAQSVWSATSEGGAGKRALKGAASGAMVGTMIFPGVGTAIGAGVGALVGAIRGWLAPTEYEKRKKDEAANRAQAGEVLGRPGMERLWNSVGAGNTPFNFAFLKSQVEHDPGAVNGYLDDMLAKHERLQSAMEKYGISWEELGEKAKQSKIDAMAEELILDFDVLMGAGADVNLIIEKMGGHIKDFAESAIRTGSEVPAAMKPMIDAFFKAGGVLDVNGEKFETAEEAGISYAKTMTQGFDSIVEAINRVAIGLGVVIPDAASKASDAITRIPKPGEPGEYMSTEYPEVLPAAHTGGYLWNGRVLGSFHRGGGVGRDGFPIWAQSGEFMMSRAAVNRIGVGALSAMNSGGAGMGSVRVELSHYGRVFADLVVPFIPGSVRKQVGVS
jgi:hypothetical protein